MKKNNKISVTVAVYHEHPDLPEEWVEEELLTIMNLLEVDADEVSIALVDDKQMKEYNKSYRGIDSPTDVLSFAYNEINEEGKYNLGDIVISVETAEAQAAEMGHSLRDECTVLMAHAALHLLGFDHEKDSGEMSKKQEELLGKMKAGRD
ncbi:MAG: rRNA maturation RNase YbeY [Acidobacteria bacterium]|nr:rRNA maturation RNase YbeY [Acidobacteriota bacterium]